MAQSKSKRLVDLLTLLLNARYPVGRERIRQLAGYPRGEDAFHRQFERDKQELREMGFPLREVGDDEEGGYVLDRARLRLPAVALTPEETVALALARRLGAFHAGVGGAVRDALGKLGLAALDVAPGPGVEVAPPPPRSRGEEERLRALELAVARGHRVRLRYRRLGDPGAVVREVDPYGLFVLGGAWYMVGFDHLREAVRTFRASRIEKVARAGRAARAEFVPPRHFRLEEHVERLRFQGWRGIEDDVIVRFEPGEAWRVGRLAGRRRCVRRGSDGALEVRFRHANPDALVAWVQGLGRGVEILGPAALRDEARRAAARVAHAHAPRRAR